jgi:chemotaxis protein methyltransferase CheR
MRRPEIDQPAMTEEEFRLLRDLVHGHCGIWFRDEMRYLLERRLGPRLQALGLRGFAEYHRFLRHDAGSDAELQEAIDVLTTNETYLWREPLQLEAFAREILPDLARTHAERRRLRILSAGCSTGEEAYTIAILVRDSGLFGGWDVEVFGVDISRRCLAQAGAGAYGDHAFRSPEAEPMRRWFRLYGGKWVVGDEIRRMVRFGRENLLDGSALASVPRLDVVFCRNVMIYFDVSARRKLLRLIHARMRAGGWLLLGHSESLINATADFEIAHLSRDIAYRKPCGSDPEVET